MSHTFARHFDDDGFAVIDQDDPIFDPQQDGLDDTEWVEFRPVYDDATINRMLSSMIKEFFSHGDVKEACRTCGRINWPASRHHVVAIILPESFLHSDAQRELCSTLLSGFVQQGVLRQSDVQRGFDLLLDDLANLSMDAPRASEYLCKFIARAVADGCLSPEYTAGSAHRQSGDAARVLSDARALLSAQDAAVHVRKIWGLHPEYHDLAVAKQHITALLQELFVSSDIDAACRCIHDLNTPHFMHEVVYQAVYLGMEYGERPNVLDLVCNLLHAMSTGGLCSSDQMITGFRRIFSSLQAILTDIPFGYRSLSSIVETCYNHDVVPSICVQELPERRYRRREISEAGSDSPVDMDM